MDTRINTDVVEEILGYDEVATFIKYEEDDLPEDTLIHNMITAVRSHFEKRTGLSFIAKTYETLFNYDDKPFVLPLSPVISIDKVEIIDYQGTKTELILNSGYNKKGLYQVEIRQVSMGMSDTLLVTYKAGYGDTATEALPFDLRDAMMKQIHQWYYNRDDFYEFTILGSIDRVLNLHKTKIL